MVHGLAIPYNTGILYQVLVQVLAALLPIQLLANVLGKAADDGLGAWPLTPMWGTQREFWVPGFDLAQP